MACTCARCCALRLMQCFPREGRSRSCRNFAKLGARQGSSINWGQEEKCHGCLALAQDRDPTHNAACLTKFTELLLLNGIISTQQMWTVFNLVGDLFEGAGEGLVWTEVSYAGCYNASLATSVAFQVLGPPQKTACSPVRTEKTDETVAQSHACSYHCTFLPSLRDAPLGVTSQPPACSACYKIAAPIASPPKLLIALRACGRRVGCAAVQPACCRSQRQPGKSSDAAALSQPI